MPSAISKFGRLVQDWKMISQHCFILADSIYPNAPPFVTPFKSTDIVRRPRLEQKRKRKFNLLHRKRRVYVEHVIKELKTFRVIGALYRHPRWEMSSIVELRAALAKKRADLIKDQSLQAIEKQLQVNNTTQAEIERLITTQGSGNKELASKQKTAHLTPLPITPIRLPTTPATPATPRIPEPLLDLPLTPTSSIPNSPQPQPLMQRLVLPMHLFNDILQPMRLTEDNLSKYFNYGTNRGSFGDLLLRHFFREIFTSDQLRIHYS
ncbi:unnamed protein product [Mytilus coruscus]|uniref:DDE Tnp4 domain-containing protein n=1 Tax=Mytilus coruscus TaxID=42192 RepID=A0A6J8CR26_MYTCO|nr:unnamed protein product [Mytilus coruscus]